MCIDNNLYLPLDFNKTLQQAMDNKRPDFFNKTHHKHLSDNDEYSSAIKGENSEDVDIYRLDSVNIDTRMMNLMENNIKYRATTEKLLRKMKILNYSIGQGGR
jgi:flagellar basal-body rod protein FlgB